MERNEVVTSAGANPTGGKLGRLAGGIDSSLKCKKGPPDEAPDKAPGEESDEAPKLENANQRFAFSLISDQHSSYLVKKLSDRLNSRCSLMKPLIRPLVKNLINPLSSATQIKDLLLHL